MGLNTIKGTGNWGGAASDLNNNFASITAEIEKLKAANVKFKGYYTTELTLKATHPSPTVGDNAWVGDTYPGTVYDVVNGQWHDTTVAPSVDTVNLSEYSKLSGDEELTGIKKMARGLELKKGFVAYGQDTLLTGVGRYVAAYVSPTFGSRILSYDGVNYYDLALGAYVNGKFGMTLKANGEVAFGHLKQTTGNDPEQVMSQDAVSKEFASVRSDLSEALSEIENQIVETSDNNISILDNKNSIILEITEKYVNAKNLKNNGENVIVESDLEDLANTKQDKIDELIEDTTEDTSNDIIFSDDNDNIVGKIDKDGLTIKTIESDTIKNEKIYSYIEEVEYTNDEDSETFAKVGSYGIKAKEFLYLDGTPIISRSEDFLCITDTIHVVVGMELCIYADAIVKSLDRGLMSPLNYKVIWNCDIGEVHDRLYKVTPSSSDIGNHVLRIRAFNMNGRLELEKYVTLSVLNITSFSSIKNILFCGDSLGAGTATQLFNRFDELGGTFPNFVGTVGVESGRMFEAYGGWRFWEFSNKGRAKFRVIVEGITTLSIGAVYENGNQERYIVNETNIDASGNGNIALSYTAGISAPSGTLTKVSGVGDNTFNVVSATMEGGNKLWNFNTNQLDIANYRSIIGLIDKIDIVCFQLLVNDANYLMSVDTVETEIKELYNAFIADNPNTKILISLGTTFGNTISGTRGNGGANYDIVRLEYYIWAYRKMLLDKFVNNENYPNIIICCPQIQLDRYYGYDITNHRTSKYVAETFVGHINLVHPNTIGYEQLSGVWVGDLLALN